MIQMAEEHRPRDREPGRDVKLDARTNTDRLSSALERIERVLREFDERLAWK